MLVIRLNRVGRKNQAQFRIVVQEHTTAPNGRHSAIVGSYDPHTKEIILKKDEIKKYIANGAQPSDTVHNLLVREGVIDGKKRSVKMPDKKVAEDDSKDEGKVEGEKSEEKDAPVADAKEDKSAEKAPDQKDAPVVEKTDEKPSQKAADTKEEAPKVEEKKEEKPVVEKEAPKEEKPAKKEKGEEKVVEEKEAPKEEKAVKEEAPKKAVADTKA